jgi:hypothetical protein
MCAEPVALYQSARCADRRRLSSCLSVSYTPALIFAANHRVEAYRIRPRRAAVLELADSQQLSLFAEENIERV